MKRLITSKQADDIEALEHPNQEFDSAKTSINSTKLPAVYRMISIPKGSVGVDFGGGSFDNAVEYISDLGATLYVYDPYNRSAEHNRQVIKALRGNGGADWAINSNVLNVIKEPEARRAVLENISKITKPDALIYITVYEGRGDNKEGPTKSGYQLNRKTQDYLEDIQEVFPDAKRKGKLITAHNTRSADLPVNASADIVKAPDLDQYTKLSFGRNWYSVHYNLIDNSPEADAHHMWLDFQASISPIKPYDDADYAWARIKDGKINIIRNGKSVKTYYYFDADDMGVENTDWCDAVIDLAIQYLEIANKDVTPRMIHNSTNIASEGGASITASADEYVYTYCDNCGRKNRVKVHFKDYSSPFDDIEYKCPYCGDGNLLHDPHIYDESGHVVNASEDTYSEPAEVTDFKNAVDSADTIDDIQFLIYGLTDGVAEEACQFAFDAALNSEVDDIDTIKHEVISAIDMYLEDNEFIEASQKLDVSADKKLTKLKDEIFSTVKDVMMSPNFGFLEDEVPEYSFVDVYPEGRVEVRSEVDYDGLMDLVFALNPIIQKYDKDSYFEPVEPGIIEAYLHI